VATKTYAIPQIPPSQVIFPTVLLSFGDFDRRKRNGTNKSLLNQAITALDAASPTIHAPDDVFARGGANSLLLEPAITSMSDVYMLRKLAIVETVDFLRKAWAERNICTWLLGFEISCPLP
jgi:hypothetical protein